MLAVPVALSKEMLQCFPNRKVALWSFAGVFCSYRLRAECWCMQQTTWHMALHAVFTSTGCATGRMSSGSWSSSRLCACDGTRRCSSRSSGCC
jgi:hypothetical protein